jgi:hypothetical protein
MILKMKCRDFETELSKAANPSALSTEALKHIDICADCAALYRSSVGFFDMVHEEKNSRVPPFLSSRVMARIGEDASEKNMLLKLKPALQVAALFLILLSGFATAMIIDKNSNMNDAELIYSDYFSQNTGLGMETSWVLNID